MTDFNVYFQSTLIRLAASL